MLVSTAYLALAPDLLVRESARPLSRKSILFATPRSEGASDLSAALVDAGARPLWCPALEHSPLDDAALGPLDEAVMRLAEYDVLCVVSRTAASVFGQRALQLADGDADTRALMLAASSVQVGAPGGVALHVRDALGAQATVAPESDNFGDLANDLAELGLLGAGARVLVPAPRWRAPLAEPPALAAFLGALGAAGASVDRVEAYEAAPPGDAAASLEAKLLRGELGSELGGVAAVDACCFGAADEVHALLAGACGGAWPPSMPPVVASTGEAADAAEALGLKVDAVAPGAGADALVAALEDFLGAGRLLW